MITSRIGFGIAVIAAVVMVAVGCSEGKKWDTMYFSVSIDGEVTPPTSLVLKALTHTDEGAVLSERRIELVGRDLTGSPYVVKLDVPEGSPFLVEAVVSLVAYHDKEPVASYTGRMGLGEKRTVDAVLTPIAVECDQDGDGYKNCLAATYCCTKVEADYGHDCDDSSTAVTPMAIAEECRICSDSDQDGVLDCVKPPELDIIEDLEGDLGSEDVVESDVEGDETDSVGSDDGVDQVDVVCEPSCEAGVCGGADGCGSTCGCSDDEACLSGICVVKGMTRVDGGEFWMGCNDVVDDQCTADELPQHLVTVAPFEMDTLEITNAQYQECVDAGVCDPLNYDNGQCFVIDPVSADWIKKVLPYEPDAKFRGAQFPALCMTWEQARQFCEDWRCPDCRLCTEAEFEVASRGACLLYEGKDCKQAISKFPWGDLEPLAALGKGAAPGNFADETAQAKYPALEAISGYVDGYAETSPVGSYPSGASKYGILDLSGNVWEWTADCWNEGYTGAPADGAAWLDGPCTQRVRRGGSWINGAADLRSSTRSGYNPTLATDLVGVRCCR